MRLRTLAFLSLLAANLPAQAAPLTAPISTAVLRDLDARIALVTPKLVAWQRDLHADPELSFSEARTAGVVAAHLKALGLDVRTNVGGSFSVVGILAHTAILMGVAEVPRSMKATLPGSVTFLFQAAQEGAPNGSATAMIDAGALDNPKVEAVYGLHTWPGPVGTVATRSGGMMASGDKWRVVIHGTQAHGAQPWRSVDPIVIGAQIVTGLRNTIGDVRVLESAPSMPAEDFSRFLERVPGLFFFLGVTPVGQDPLSMPANHSPRYDVDEAAIPTGVNALSALAIDALTHGVAPLGTMK